MFKTNLGAKLILLTLSLGINAMVFGQGTAITYQGKLTDSGNLANGQYDLQFKLFDTATVGTGTQQGSTATVSNVTVTAGVFTAQLDFGSCSTCFDGSARFLEIAVKLTSGSSFTTLGPRQPVTSNPYAMRSLNSATADGLSVACINCVTSSQIGSVQGSQVMGSISGSQINTPIPVASVPAGSASYIQNQNASAQANSDFNISGNGAAGGTLSGQFVNATMKYNLGGQPILSNPGTNNLFAGANAGSNNTGASNSFFGFNAGLNNTTGAFNTFVGANAGQSNVDGGANSFFGVQAGQLNTSGVSNSFFGFATGVSNTTGFDNAFFGDKAGQNNSTGTKNSFFGTRAGLANTGSFNSFFGALAGQFNSTGIANSFFGNSAGGSSTTGANNSFFGTNAGAANTTGGNNTFIGANANAGANNLLNATAIGFGAFVNQSNSLVLGSISGLNGATADTNVGIGTTAPISRLHVAGDALVTGNFTVNGTLNANLPSGSSDYIQNTTSTQPSSNFHISGNGTAGGTLTGSAVTATTVEAFVYKILGSRVLGAPGDSNLFAGVDAGGSNSGTFNAFFGAGAGFANTTGCCNAIFGAFAGRDNTTGGGNSIFGQGAGGRNTIGQNNSFIGRTAGFQATGSKNTFVGADADFSSSGSLAAGDNNTLLGYGALLTPDIDNSTAIGANASVTQSNSLVLGGINGVNSATADTKVGIGTTAPTAKLTISGNGAFNASGAARFDLFNTTANAGFLQHVLDDGRWQLATTAGQTRILVDAAGNVGIGANAPADKLHVNGIVRVAALGVADTTTTLCRNSSNQIATCNSSSLRYKTDIQSFTGGLEIVKRLHPITFTWKQGGARDIGFGAEDVAKVEPLFTFTDDKGQIEGVKYDRLGVALVNAIKEQQEQIKQLQSEIEALKRLVCLEHPKADLCKSITVLAPER